MANAKRDANRKVTLMGVTDDSNLTPTNLIVDPTSKRLKVSATISSITATGRILEAQGADVASANNLSLGTDGNSFEITGTTPINLISNVSWQNGSVVTLLFTSTPTVKHAQTTSGTNIKILLAGALDFAATANDSLTLRLGEVGGTQAWYEICRTTI